MMENRRSSDEVVLPDITEVSDADELSAAASADDGGERAGNRAMVLSTAGIKSGRMSSTPNGVISVPVTLPVGGLIAGTTYNVITSDQLPHFKPMLCVDNGFISGGSTGEDTKTHVVLQSTPSPVSHADPEDSGGSTRDSNRSWAETVNMPVLPVRCKNTSAELHKNRFGSGGRGKCIKHGLDWYTPSEFEALCGRASSKDWKRSIRFGGRSIQALIDEGILTPHATSCTCGACVDDQSAMGPVRLFTPYKRRRRNLQDIDEKKAKVKHVSTLVESDMDNIHQTSSRSDSHSKEAWQTLAVSLDGATEYQLLDHTETSTDPIEIPEITEMSGVLKRLEDIGQSLGRLATELKQCVEEVGAVNARQLDRAEQARPSGLLSASVDVDLTLPTVEDPDTKKCGNCNRVATAECSLCRRTPYCSIYCQKKDWASHQIECLRTVPAMHPDVQHHQSIMLIVESHHQ